MNDLFDLFLAGPISLRIDLKKDNHFQGKRVVHIRKSSKAGAPSLLEEFIFRVCLASDLQPVTPDTIRTVASGRGSLGFALGDKTCRFRLFSGNIQWNRVFLAQHETQAIGFLAFQHHGQGPYKPKLADFLDTFGWSACWRYPMFCWLEARTWQHEFYIYGLKVNKRCRRMRIASALLEATEKHAESLGVKCITLEVFASNQRAMNLYKLHGYTLKQARQLHWWRLPENSATVWLLEKRLSS